MFLGARGYGPGRIVGSRVRRTCKGMDKAVWGEPAWKPREAAQERHQRGFITTPASVGGPPAPRGECQKIGTKNAPYHRGGALPKNIILYFGHFRDWQEEV